MDELNHWATMVKCSLCGEIPESAPLYQCPFQHQYCVNCITDLKKLYRGNVKGGSTCVICKVTAVFTQSKINTDFLHKIKTKPGIGRPCRYNANPLANGYSGTQKKNGLSDPIPVTVEGLFRLPSAEVQKLLHKNDFTFAPKETAPVSISRTPIKCPHKPCKKTVAASSFVSHFKHEHPDIPKYYIERGKELCLPCNLFCVEHSSHFCLAMITVYETNKIDVRKSKSCQSVIKTCGRFTQQVPIDSFWLMGSGSHERRPNLSSALYWLFSTSEERYQATVELSSKYDSVAFSTYCGVNVAPGSFRFGDICEALNCLVVSRASLCALLREGSDINLRVTVH